MTTAARVRVLLAAVLVLVVLGGISYALLGGEEEPVTQPAPAASGGATPSVPELPPELRGLPTVDGMVVLADATVVVLRPFTPVGGREELEFAVRAPDARLVNVPHLRVHSSDGLPSRIFYTREGGRLLAKGQVDAPFPPGVAP